MKKSMIIALISGAVTVVAATGVTLGLTLGSNDSGHSGGDDKCNHTYVSEITKEATCKEEGVKTYTCDECGDSYTESIAKTDEHSYESKVTKEATCTQKGVKTYTCEECGDSYTEEIKKELSCNYKYIYDANGHVATCKWCSNTNGKKEHELNTFNRCECGYVLSYSGLSFSIANDGKSYIVSKGSGYNIIIPKYHNGLPISAIAVNAFRDSYVETVKILAEIKEIPYGAFMNCNDLESIEMPDTITVIENMAFRGCKNVLWSNQLPKNLQEIGDMAFQECQISVLGFTIPKTVKKIGSKAFYKAWGWKRIYFEDIKGWKADGESIGLSNEGTTNFDYLTSYTYLSAVWTKEE